MTSHGEVFIPSNATLCKPFSPNSRSNELSISKLEVVHRTMASVLLVRPGTKHIYSEGALGTAGLYLPTESLTTSTTQNKSYLHIPRPTTISNTKLAPCLAPDLLDARVGIVISQRQPLVVIDIKASQLRNDHMHASTSCQRQITPSFDLRLAVFVAMRLYDDDLGGFRVGDEVHGTAHAFDHLTGDH